MNPAIVTTARVVHDLGLAANFGGSLFGKTALKPAARTIDAKDARTRIVSSAWMGFSPWNAIALVAVGVTWIAGRSSLTCGTVDRTTRGLVVAKDALVGATIASGLGSMITGYVVARSRREEAPALEAGLAPPQTEKRRTRTLQRVSDGLGYVNLIGGAALIGLTAALAMRTVGSRRSRLVSKVLG